MKTVLLTGFEPFGGYKVNPSQLLLEELTSSHWQHFRIYPYLLPVDSEKVKRQFPSKIRALKPDIILSMGQADGRTMVSLERVAINLVDFRIPDNAGKQFRNKPVIRSGPSAYFARLPLERILTLLGKKKIPAAISNTAGTYLCNQVMYLGLHVTAKMKKKPYCGFIHVPLLPEQVTDKKVHAPSMAFSDMKKAMEIILNTLR